MVLADKYKRTGMVGTILFHLILLALLLFSFITPEPKPISENFKMEMIVDFGVTNNGSGNVESPTPADNNSVESNNESTTDNTVQAEDIVTADNNTIHVDDGQSQEVQPQQHVNPLAMYNGSNSSSENNGGGSDGLGQGIGNEGDPNGVPNGTGWALAGRTLDDPAKITDKVKENGDVVMNIWVDRNGNVIRSSISKILSTLHDTYHLGLAKKALDKVKFSANPSAPVEQKGTYTFRFRLE